MADTQGQKEPVKETQGSAMPTDEKKTQPTETVSSTVPEKEEAATETSVGGLPETASDRTRREFEKLRDDLRTERAKRQYIEQVYQSMQPKKEESKLPPVYDPQTGLLNEEAFSQRDKRLQEAEERARRAEDSVQQYISEQEAREAYVSHPGLDPDGKVYNHTLHVEARRLMLDSMMHPEDYGRKQLSLKEAGDIAAGKIKSSLEAAKKEGAVEALEKLTPKEQASLEAVGTSGRRTQVAGDLETLRDLSLSSDEKVKRQAILERIRRLPNEESE